MTALIATRIKRNLLLGSTLAAICSLPVHAQSTAPESGADDGSAMGSEILVTARKRAESLIDIPLSINALNATDITQKTIRDLQDVADLTPGLRYTDFLTKFNGNVTIRGLAQTNVQNAVGNVGVFVDGIYLQRGYMVDSQLGDLERIEVVKGPQSALYGQNTFSGAINYVLRMPTEELKINALASAGNAEFNEVRVGVGGPIIPGILFGRVYYARANYGGTWKNNFPGVTGSDFEHFSGYKRENFSGTLELRPIDGMSIRGTYYKLKRSEKPRAMYEINGNFPEDKRTCGAISPVAGAIYPNPIPYFWCGNLPANRDETRSGLYPEVVLPGLSAVPQPGMISSTRMMRVQASYELLPGLSAVYDYGNVKGIGIEETVLRSNQWKRVDGKTNSKQREAGLLTYRSHEAKLLFDDGGPLKIDGGVFQSRARDQFLFGLDVMQPGVPQFLNSPDPLDRSAAIKVIDQDTTYKIKSAYGRVSYTFLDDSMTLSAEGRYTHTFQRKIDNQTPTLPALEATWKNFTPRVTLEYRPMPSMLTYVTWARGVKAGGFNGYVSGPITLDPEERPFGEEKNTSYEIGIKGEALNRRLAYQVAAFYVDWVDRQIAVPPNQYDQESATEAGQGVAAIFKTAGSARSYGIELTLDYRLTDELSTKLSGTYQNATQVYNERAVLVPAYFCDNIVCNTNGDTFGNRLPMQPMWQGALSVNYRKEIANGVELFAGVDEIYRGHTYTDATNVTGTAPYLITNARIGIEKGPLQAMLWVKNALNHKYVDAAFTLPTGLQDDVNLGELRTFGVTVQFNY